MVKILFRAICIRKSPNKKILSDTKKILWRGVPVKSLTYGLKECGGRNSTGRQTVFHRGGGHKKKIRKIYFGNFSNSKSVQYAKVIRTEYDPNRTAWISLLELVTNSNKDVPSYFYTLATHGLNIGDLVSCGFDATPKLGNRLPLSKIPSGLNIHSIEVRPHDGSKLVRSAGTSATLIRNVDTQNKALIQLPSGQRIKISADCFATIGSLSNNFHNRKILRKAGVSRWLGIRPVTRGVAKNPVDHPHGGRTKGGVCPKTPWGKLTRGVPTRPKRKPILIKKRGSV